MIEECGHDQRPAMAEDADQPPASALWSGRTGHGRKRRDRDGCFGLAPDGKQPPRRDGDGEPETLGPRGIGHPGVVPLPPAPLDLFETLLYPSSQAVPTGIGDLRWQIGEEQPRRLMAFAPIRVSTRYV